MNVLIVYKDKEDSKNKISKIRFDNYFKVKYSWKNTLEKQDLKNADIVISIGGDGTALSAANYLIDKPLLAVNSSPKTSEGALTTVSLEELEEKLRDIKNKGYKTEKLERIEVSINGRTISPLALNEVFIANERAYLISRYKILFENGINRTEEKQMSSGLIFTTGTGSTGWFKSAGGEPFSPQAKFIKMLVREPFIRRLSKFNLVSQTIKEKDLIEVSSGTKSVLAIDSIREFKIKEGDRIRIKVSENPLLRIV